MTIQRADKRNRLLRRSSAGAGLLLGVSGMLLAGCNRPSEETINATPAQSPVPPVMPGRNGPFGRPGMSPGRLRGPRPGSPGLRPGQVGPGIGAPGAAKRDPFAPGAAGRGAAPARPVVSFPSRKGFDPFYPTWHVIPPPPDVFTEIQPIRVAGPSVDPPPEEPVVVREVADRRVSGIMSGDGVFAIIEQNGASEVVKPGGTTADGYRVISINDDSVKLQKKEGNVLRTQVVQLSDIQTGANTQSFGRPGNFGQGRTPGNFPGRPGPGRPGISGAGGGGKSD